jgi:hypothetical protein
MEGQVPEYTADASRLLVDRCLTSQSLEASPS